VPIALLFVAVPSLAASDVDPDWEHACSVTCVRDGFTIEVLASTFNTGSMVRLWGTNAHQFIDAAHYQSGDAYLGHQSASSPLAGGPYCTSYPGAGGHFIDGAVYDRVVDYNWEWVETGWLSLSPDVACDGSIPYLLGLLDLYGTGTFVLPSGCSDIGCAGGDGVDPEDPGTGAGEYTDASGEAQPFDDLGQTSSGGAVDEPVRSR
jgi:hypothetical protein